MTLHSLTARMSWIAYLVATLASLGTPCNAQDPPVPQTFQDLYSTLNGDLTDFNTALNGLWKGARYPVLYAGELSNANSNNGPQLLSLSALPAVQNDLVMLKALGVQAVAVEVSFPMLYEPFFATSSEYQQYVGFYSEVAHAIRAQGLKLIVESQSMMPGGLASGFGPQVAAFYPSLDWTQYQAARAQAAQVVAQTMQPDYFVLQEEPDTEARQSGQANVDTVSGATSMLERVASSVLLAGVPGMKLGAGVGSWLWGFQGFINSYTHQQCSASQPCITIPLDFIDMHIFPINELGPPMNNKFWQNALTIVSMAAAAGKPVTLSQTWLRKVRNTEWGVLSGDIQESREVYSFWEPLDAAFLQTIVNLANYAQMPFVNPFNTQNFSTYLTYSASLSNLLPSQIFSQELSAAAAALQQGSYSPTGLSYYSSIVSPPDTIPPSSPDGLVAVATSPTNVNVRWSASTDNVGVAGYYIWRNGVQLPSTALTYLQDTGLSGHTSYTYQIAAYDLAFNVSQPAIVTIKTPNSTGPNPPLNLTGVASSVQQINLVWSAPTGVIPTSYLVFRGLNAASMSQIQQLSSTVTSFSDYDLTPGTTYYYGVEALAGGLASAMSNIVAVTTLPMPPPPGNLAGTASSATQITLTWSLSAGSATPSSYLIFRGSSATSMIQTQQLTGTATSFKDANLTPATTYCYGLEAVAGGLASGMSNVVAVTTHSLPTPPVGGLAR